MSAEPVKDNEPWTVRRVLDWTIDYLKSHGSQTPRLDAEILLAFARRCKRIQLYTQYNETLSDAERELMRSLVKRRANSEPVAYLVGHREFFSLDFEITRDVFIPRPDTETLVVAALDVLKPLERPDVLELCTGTGCLPVAIAKNHLTARITTIEREPNVISVAQRNINRHNVSDRVTLLPGDLFDPLPNDRHFDLILSNPPYIPSAEIDQLQDDVRKHEPRVALDGGDDGLDIIRKLIDHASRYLKRPGWLMFELGEDQSQAAIELMNQGGFSEVSAQDDLSGIPRVVLGCCPGDAS